MKSLGLWYSKGGNLKYLTQYSNIFFIKSYKHFLNIQLHASRNFSLTISKSLYYILYSIIWKNTYFLNFIINSGSSCWNVVCQIGTLTMQLPINHNHVKCGSPARYSDRLHDFSVTIPRCYKDVYVNSFFPCTARLWNFLPLECFPLTYNLNGMKSRINRHLLTVGFL